MPSTSDNATALVLSAGLFLATALASQWLQNHMKNHNHEDVLVGSGMDDESTKERQSTCSSSRRRVLRQQRIRRNRQNQKHHHNRLGHYLKNRHLDDNDMDDDGDDDKDEEGLSGEEGYQEDDEPNSSDARRTNDEQHVNEDIHDFYKHKRLKGRLSFENLRPLIHEAVDSDGVMQAFSTSFPPSTPPHKTNAHQHHHHHRPPRRRHHLGSAIDREDDYDFRPKNSNWNHFEKHNEDDVKNGVVVPGLSQPDGYHFQAQAFSDGNEYNHDSTITNKSSIEDSDRSARKDLAEASSVDSSDSSEEPQFVWTNHVRKLKRQSALALTIPDAIQDHQPPAAVPTQKVHKRSPTGGDESEATIPVGNTTAAHRRDPSSPERHPLQQQKDDPGAPSGPAWLPPSPSPIQQRRSTTGENARGASHAEKTAPSIISSQPRKTHTVSGDDLVTANHRSARAQYNAKIMPNKVVLVRHGQSMGNINEDLYSTTPDNAMSLTELGWQQARKAGQHLKNHVLAPNESVHFIVSPYARTVETFHGIVSAWCDPDSPEFECITDREMRLKAWYGRLLDMGLTWHEDPRIREQDFGNYQDPEQIRKAKRDRHRFGIFYYRFPHGESASDVFDRVSTFLDSLWRSFDMNRSRNYVLITHGISIRVLLARYFRYTIHQFNMLSNPRNCEMVALGHDGHGRLRLQGRYQLHLRERTVQDECTMSNGEKTQERDVAGTAEEDRNQSTGANNDSKETVWEVDEYRFYKRLRILPQEAIRKVDIRVSFKDRASGTNGL